jgi:Na+/proline symporter
MGPKGPALIPATRVFKGTTFAVAGLIVAVFWTALVGGLLWTDHREAAAGAAVGLLAGLAAGVLVVRVFWTDARGVLGAASDPPRADPAATAQSAGAQPPG